MGRQAPSFKGTTLTLSKGQTPHRSQRVSADRPWGGELSQHTCPAGSHSTLEWCTKAFISRTSLTTWTQWYTIILLHRTWDDTFPGSRPTHHSTNRPALPSDYSHRSSTSSRIFPCTFPFLKIPVGWKEVSSSLPLQALSFLPRRTPGIFLWQNTGRWGDDREWRALPSHVGVSDS